MVSYNVLVKENNPYRVALYNTRLGATRDNYSNKVLAILLYRKQLSY
jgi:hypothetical protein